MREKNLIMIGILGFVICLFLMQIVFAGVSGIGPTPTSSISQVLSIVSDQDGNTLIKSGDEQLAKFPPGYEVTMRQGNEITAKNTEAKPDQVIEFKDVEIKTELFSEVKMTENEDGSSLITIPKGKGDVKIGDQNFNNLEKIADFKVDSDGKLINANFMTKSEGTYTFQDQSGKKFNVFKSASSDAEQITFDSENNYIRATGKTKLTNNDFNQYIKIGEKPATETSCTGNFDETGNFNHAIIRNGEYHEEKIGVLKVPGTEGSLPTYQDIKPTFSSEGEFEVMKVETFGSEQPIDKKNYVSISEIKGDPMYKINGEVNLNDFERKYAGLNSESSAYYDPLNDKVTVFGDGKIANGKQAVTLEGGEIKFTTSNFVSDSEPLKLTYKPRTESYQTDLVLGKQNLNSGAMATALKNQYKGEWLIDEDVLIPIKQEIKYTLPNGAEVTESAKTLTMVNKKTYEEIIANGKSTIMVDGEEWVIDL